MSRWSEPNWYRPLLRALRAGEYVVNACRRAGIPRRLQLCGAQLDAVCIALEVSHVNRQQPAHPIRQHVGVVNLPSADGVLAGDALLRIKQQLPYGAWTPALEERDIPVRTAQRFIRLRQTYPQIRQLVAFDSVSAALTKAIALTLRWAESQDHGRTPM